MIMLKNTLYLMVLLFLSSFAGASCFNESSSSEDLEIGSQFIDVFVCEGVEVRDSMSFILPVFYFLLFILIGLFAILMVMIVVKVVSWKW